MKTTQSRIIMAVAIVILVGVTWFAFQRPSATPIPIAATNPSSTATSSVAATTTPTPTATAPKGTGSAPATKTTTKASMTVTAPAAGTKWILDTPNAISWSKATGITGQIVLLNAANGAVVGWIQQNLAPTQTSFAWDTNDVFPSVTSPSKKIIGLGTYAVRISFASPSFPTITSAPFTVIAAYQTSLTTEAVTVKNYVASPSSLTVPQGTHVIFTNDDSVDYQITTGSGGTFDLKPNATYVLDTSIFTPGSYPFYSTVYPTLRTTVTVR